MFYFSGKKLRYKAILTEIKDRRKYVFQNINYVQKSKKMIFYIKFNRKFQIKF